MNGDFYAGRRAVVTGAGAGIGRALAIQLAARGADVVLWDCDGDGLARTAERCRRWDVSVQPRVVDVGDRAGVNEQARTTTQSGPVDLLFCIAGTIHTGTLMDSDLDDVEHVMRVNFWGTVNAVKALLPSLAASGRGHVVTVSSAFGLMAAPRYTAYCASKFAVRGFTEALRQELALGGQPVGVSCAYPGGVRTQIVRKGRFAAGEDADAVSDRFDRHLARTTASTAATVILRGVRRGKPQILVGPDAWVVSGLLRMTGASYQSILPRIMQRTTAAERARLPKRP